jgi:hypothetical protein
MEDLVNLSGSSETVTNTEMINGCNSVPRGIVYIKPTCK